MLCFLALTAQYGEDLKDRPDSIRYILGVHVDDSTMLELPGEDVFEFRLYTASSKSIILWKYEKDYYVYSFTDSDHITRATRLFELIQKNGIVTFVAQRDYKTIRFNKYRKVIAIQIAGTGT
jgi:hypothetical protein